MTEPKIQYQAGPAASLPHYFVSCTVSVPGDSRDPDTGRFVQVRCPAKVECADVVDALDLDRWTTQAFQLIWRSGSVSNIKHREKALAEAQWFLERGYTRERHWQSALADVIARVLEDHASDDDAVALAERIRAREEEAMIFVGELYASELTPTRRPVP